MGQVGGHGLAAPLQNGRRAAGCPVPGGECDLEQAGNTGRLGQALPALGERLQW